MAAPMQNPGWQAGASRNQLGSWLLPSLTVTDQRTQLLAGRFVLSQPLARDVAHLCFGEAHND